MEKVPGFAKGFVRLWRIESYFQGRSDGEMRKVLMDATKMIRPAVADAL